VDELLTWFKEKDPEHNVSIPRDVDLIETRLIDSLNFLEFVILLERVSGKSVDLSSLNVDDFRTLERIETGFLSV